MKVRALRSGDIVDVVAPASRCPVLDLKLGVDRLRSMGLVPRVPKNLFGSSALFANRDEVRLKQLSRALTAEDSQAIWCVRGGYGSMRLLPELAKLKRNARPKIFIGFSDITSLHTFLNQEWGWPTLHGPMLGRLGRGESKGAELWSLFGFLFGTQTEFVFESLKPLNQAARSQKVIRGQVVGGNMAVLQSGFSTPFELRPRGNILFFEDIGEKPHRVDRMLTQMKQAGWFKQARAVVFGQFLMPHPSEKRILSHDVLARFAKDCAIPVLSGLPVGHEPKRQMPLPLGTPAQLHLGRSPHLRVLSGWSNK